MKTFIFTEERFPNRMRNNRRLRIYRVVKNTPDYLGFLDYTTGCSSSKCEAFRWLIEKGFIHKKYYNLGARVYDIPEGCYPPNLEDYGYKVVEVV